MPSRLGALLLLASFAAGAYADRHVWTPNGETQFVGRALDSATGKPIAGTSVIATYILGSGGVHGGARCTWAEFVRSNERGEYVLPYYEGLPPQFLSAFAHRYVRPKFLPKAVTKDESLRWIVDTRRLVDGRVQVIGREGPFKTQEEAGRASRLLQDVWLEEFTGSDEEWVARVRTTNSNAGPGCPSQKTSGVVGWNAAKLAEIEAMPDSATRTDAIKSLREILDFAISQQPEAAARLKMEERK